jgi:hypothetical protein
MQHMEFHGATSSQYVIPGTTPQLAGLPTHGSSPVCEPFSTVPFAPDPNIINRPKIVVWVCDKCARPGAWAALVGGGVPCWRA